MKLSWQIISFVIINYTSNIVDCEGERCHTGAFVCAADEGCIDEYLLCAKPCTSDQDCNGEVCEVALPQGGTGIDKPFERFCRFTNLHWPCPITPCVAPMECNPYTLYCQNPMTEIPTTTTTPTPTTPSNLGGPCGKMGSKRIRCASGLVCNPSLLFDKDDNKLFRCSHSCTSNSDCFDGLNEVTCNLCGKDGATYKKASYCRFNVIKNCIKNNQCTNEIGGNGICNKAILKCVDLPEFCS